MTIEGTPTEALKATVEPVPTAENFHKAMSKLVESFNAVNFRQPPVPDEALKNACDQFASTVNTHASSYRFDEDGEGATMLWNMGFTLVSHMESLVMSGQGEDGAGLWEKTFEAYETLSDALKVNLLLLHQEGE